MLEENPNTVLNTWSFNWYFGSSGEAEVVSLINSGAMGTGVIHRCSYCNDMQFISCSSCAQIECMICPMNGGGCEDCGRKFCEDCEVQMDEYARVGLCSYYETCPARCGRCRTQNCCNGTNNCNGCRAKVFDKILAENIDKQTKIDQLGRQIEDLRVSNE